MRYWLKFFPLIVIIVFVSGCMRAVPKAPLKSIESFSSITAANIDFADDLDPASLELAIEHSINYYENAGRKKVYRIADRLVSAQQLKETLTTFRAILRKTGNTADLSKKIAAEFNVYRIAGNGNSNNALFTGYYEPLLEGSLTRTEKYRYPLYRVPPDLVRNENNVGRMKDGKFVPYYSRREIDVDGVLQRKNLELVWVADPVELFSLHIQGSGKIKLEDGTLLTVGFAQTNGRPFRSITKFMLDGGKINSSEASYRHLFLKGKPEQEIYDILSHNERYTFFRFLDKEPVGSLGEPVTPGRSIATDPDFFPEGALAFIRLRKPVFDTEGNVKERVNFSRFVLNQDKGSAIEGPGRVDLFCGFGEKAEYTAGTLKENGELYLLLKK
ncbi:MAG: MltA domain-containing protein [Deltaproteobacteria bacterium]|nr:MltA domain-containing protein [Deltaproteobacteria bacterium]